MGPAGGESFALARDEHLADQDDSKGASEVGTSHHKHHSLLDLCV